ncbi:hypothetical protein [Shinella pollutisoli]|uniref:Secreted protein n=1 Tax=Shinella pollutisoli TaxID=2250594 RepID=A0ABV7DBT3_9HYPH|nr:hypothetical protein [Shinella pollutisoli]
MSSETVLLIVINCANLWFCLCLLAAQNVRRKMLDAMSDMLVTAQARRVGGLLDDFEKVSLLRHAVHYVFLLNAMRLYSPHLRALVGAA